jgi:hypothetical protein
VFQALRLEMAVQVEMVNLEVRAVLTARVMTAGQRARVMLANRTTGLTDFAVTACLVWACSEVAE